MSNEISTGKYNYFTFLPKVSCTYKKLFKCFF